MRYTDDFEPCEEDQDPRPAYTRHPLDHVYCFQSYRSIRRVVSFAQLNDELEKALPF